MHMGRVSSSALAPGALPGPGGGAAVPQHGPSLHPCCQTCISRAPPQGAVNSRDVRPGLCLWVGQAQDLLLITWYFRVQAAGLCLLQQVNYRPGKSNQINTPTAGGCSKNSGFREPPHPAEPNCHLSLPWDRSQGTGLGSWAHGVMQTWETRLFLTTPGHRPVLISPTLTPHLATGGPVSRCATLGGVAHSLAEDGRWFSLHVTTLICWHWLPGVLCCSFGILSRFERSIRVGY